MPPWILRRLVQFTSGQFFQAKCWTFRTSDEACRPAVKNFGGAAEPPSRERRNFTARTGLEPVRENH